MEKQTYLDTFKHLKSLIKEGAESHNKLLEYRYSVKKSLAHQGIEDQKKLLALQNGTQTPIRARKVDQSRGAVQTLEVGTMGNSEVSLYGAVLIPPFLSAASPILLSRTSLIFMGTSVSLYLTLPTVHTSSSLFTASQTNSSSNSLQLAKMEVCHLLYFLLPSVSFSFPLHFLTAVITRTAPSHHRTPQSPRYVTSYHSFFGRFPTTCLPPSSLSPPSNSRHHLTLLSSSSTAPVNLCSLPLSLPLCLPVPSPPLYPQMSWEDTWSLVSARTGLIEPDIFFQRLNNG